jgi:hypothetical protein
MLITYSASAEENLSEDIDQLFELTKIIVLVLSGLVPGLEESNSKGMYSSSALAKLETNRVHSTP